MAKGFSLPGFVAVLLALLSCTIAVEITEIFTVQDGTREGGCDHRAAVLDQWLSETIESIDTALRAIDEYDQEIRVRRSMSAFFHIANQGRLRPDSDKAAAVAQIRGEC